MLKRGGVSTRTGLFFAAVVEGAVSILGQIRRERDRMGIDFSRVTNLSTARTRLLGSQGSDQASDTKRRRPKA
jgi:hypothetical protein